MPSRDEILFINRPERVVKNSITLRPLILVVGPTGVGKTTLSLQLAIRLNGEIISADSRLFYRGMDIGTAKPSLAERSLVPHHLIDVADPDQVWSLAMFQESASHAIQSAHAEGHLPFLVGGTGQYIRAVVEGWSLPRVKPHPRMRSVLEQWSHEVTPQGLHNRLRAVDFTSAEQIDARNVRRTIRALEVIFTTGKRFSEQRIQEPPPYSTFTIGLFLPRDELFKRIDLRIHEMIDAGFEAEVQALINLGYASDLAPFSAIGYKEMIDHIYGKLSLAEAIDQMKRRTRVLVRRQANWFKLTDPSIRWYNSEPSSVDQIVEDIRMWLSTSPLALE